MLKVQGYSDDIVLLQGDIDEEFTRYDSKGDYLGFSDGTLLRVVYDDDALWRFTVITKGALFHEKVEGSVEEDRNDVVTFHDGIKWCVCGPDVAKTQCNNTDCEVEKDNE